MQKKLCYLDWLQINLLKPPGQDIYFSEEYIRIKKDYRTRHFEIIEDIYYNDLLIGTLIHKPLSNILNKNSAQFKFQNNILYSSELKNIANNFILNSNLSVKNISRLDICCDFQYFLDGLQPHKFIKDYVSGKYIKMGKSFVNFDGKNMYSETPDIYTKTGKKINLSDKNQMDIYNVKGKTTEFNKFHYIGFGGKSSVIKYYLYNKSEEMRDVKNKPWITDMWSRNGLDMSLDTWRLEFRITSTKKKFIDLSTGMLTSVRDLSVIDKTNYIDIYEMLLSHYFNFSYTSTDTNKSRLEPLKLFDTIYDKIIIDSLSDKIASDRMDKIYIKKYYNDIAKYKESDPVKYDTLYKYIFDYILARNLSAWYKEHVRYF